MKSLMPGNEPQREVIVPDEILPPGTPINLRRVDNGVDYGRFDYNLFQRQYGKHDPRGNDLYEAFITSYGSYTWPGRTTGKFTDASNS